LHEENENTTKEKTAKTLHTRIPNTDRRPAIPAFSAEFDPTEDRNVVIPSDRMSTGRTMRWRMRQTLPLGQTMDEDIQKTPNASTESDEPKGQKRKEQRVVFHVWIFGGTVGGVRPTVSTQSFFLVKI